VTPACHDPARPSPKAINASSGLLGGHAARRRRLSGKHRLEQLLRHRPAHVGLQPRPEGVHPAAGAQKESPGGLRPVTGASAHGRCCTIRDAGPHPFLQPISGRSLERVNRARLSLRRGTHQFLRRAKVGSGVRIHCGVHGAPCTRGKGNGEKSIREEGNGDACRRRGDRGDCGGPCGCRPVQGGSGTGSGAGSRDAELGLARSELGRGGKLGRRRELVRAVI
jgi:hypothetical protein